MNYPQYPQKMLNFMLDTVFPITCLGCGSFAPQNKREYLCKSCLRLIPIKKDLECIGCKTKSQLGKTCIECRGWSIDHLFIVSDYKNKLLEKALKALKYRFITDLTVSFYPLIGKYIHWLAKKKNFSIISDNPLIVPVPLHPRRLNWRGFNQAEVISKIIAGITQLEVKNDILFRIAVSKPQADIEKKEERLKNMVNKFKISTKQELKNRTIILADDICTTGATLNECAKVLKNAGAKKVIGFVVARG